MRGGFNSISQIAVSGSAVIMDDTVVTIDDIGVINIVGEGDMCGIGGRITQKSHEGFGS